MVVALILNDVLTFILANMITYDYENKQVEIHADSCVYKSGASIDYDEYKDMTSKLLTDKYLDLSGNFFEIERYDN